MEGGGIRYPSGLVRSTVDPARPSTGTGPGASACAAGRPQLILLGQQGRVWEFVPLALAWLQARPGDDELRLMLATAYARLGLRTPALEQASLVADAPPTLRQAIERLAETKLTTEARVASARSGVQALARRGVDLSGALPAWEARAGGEEWFACGDGNVVRRSAATHAWISFTDARRAARGPLPINDPKGQPLPPIYLEGIDPPWLLLRLATERAPTSDGYEPRITTIVQEPREVLDALAHGVLGELLPQQRFELLVGPGAGAELRLRLESRLLTQLGSNHLSLHPPQPKRGEMEGEGESPAEILRDAAERQGREAARTLSAVMARYAGRDAAWWAGRYGAAEPAGALNTTAGASLRDPGRPLRVLIPTSRFSTYIQHASADIGAAFEAAGCEARVFMEPDASSVLLRCAYAKAIEEFEPDLVLLINYPRAHLAGVAPAGVPFVCWVQDAMPHLFSSAGSGPGGGGSREAEAGAGAGHSPGDLDFLVGHAHAELIDRLAGDRRRCLPCPVLASAAKFHDGPADAQAIERLRCEVACVTHHSQTPAEMLARMQDDTPDPGGKALLAELAELAQELVDHAMSLHYSYQMRPLIEDRLRRCGAPSASDRVLLLTHQVIRPLMDRILRHQTLDWAAEIAQRRGWTLHLYGRGWERHPTLARFAKGPLAHGEDLRAAYQAAACHLHASMAGNHHQRVFECALSGGLPLCRLKLDDIALLSGFANAVAASRADRPDGVRAGRPFVATASDGELMSYVAQLQRLGVIALIDQNSAPLDPAGFAISAELAADPWRATCGRPEPRDAAWLLGDLCESTFWTRETLEARLERAIERPRWRAELAGGIRARVRSHATYESAARSIIGFIRAELARSSGATGQEAAA